jgi:hypothetical protein
LTTLENAYPKMMYGPNGLTTVVGSEIEEQAVIGPGWGTSPRDEHRLAMHLSNALPSPASSSVLNAPPAAAPADPSALAELVAQRVAEILAPLLPKRTGRPPNSERQESLDG